MPIIDHFGFLAPYYDRVIGARQPESLMQRLRLPVEGALLDAGGGTGRVSQTLIGKAKPVVIADASVKMLLQAAGKDSLRPVCSKSEHLPFPEASFERVLMVDALHHVLDQALTLAELWRELKPGGRLVIEEPDIHSMSVKVVALFEKIALMRSHFLSPERIAGMVSFPEARLSIEREGYTAWVVVDKLLDGQALAPYRPKTVNRSKRLLSDLVSESRE